MEIAPLSTPQVRAYYDPAEHIVHVVYQSEVTPQVTKEVYSWTADLAQKVPPGTVRGAIYDFRATTQFVAANISTVQRESRTLNSKVNMSNIPVALIVTTLMQEQMVRVGMKITPEENRKRIVKSEEEALSFIQQWHARSHPPAE